MVTELIEFPKEQHRATEQKISDAERKIIREHYQKCDSLIREFRAMAIIEIINKDKMLGFINRAMDLMDCAIVQLPECFEGEMKRLVEFFEKGKNLEAFLEKGDVEAARIEFLIKEGGAISLDLESLYARYLKIK